MRLSNLIHMNIIQMNKYLSSITISFLFIFNLCAQQDPLGEKASRLINPVLDADFPDPTVINIGGTFHAYATQGAVHGKLLNIQIAKSEDLQHWEIIGDALPGGTNWAKKDFWAPHVLYDEDLKKYVMLFSGESEDTSIGKCIGVAYADKPEGPFIDRGSPLVCGEAFTNIDPMVFLDPKTKRKLLYWGSNFGPIMVRELKADYSAFKDESVGKPILYPNVEKQYDRLVEGAWIDYNDGKYYLYYSGDNCCGGTANYAVMVARADFPEGPFERLGSSTNSSNSVVLKKDSRWLAPGHNSIFRDDKGNVYTAYHAIKTPTEKQKSANYLPRLMLIKKVKYENGWPSIIE